MTDYKIEEMSITDIRQGISKGDFTAESITRASFDRISQLDQSIHAFITLRKDEAIAEAIEIDRKLAAGQTLGTLAGVPIAVKDNISTKGLQTSCGSKMLESYVPPFEATVIDKLRAEGAIIIGKTNMDEFAMGSSTENSYFGPTKNPWDLSKVPGGSSGGAAAALSAGYVPLSFGSDTGGSIRQPAAFCGGVGLKPTYGMVSRYGLVAFASSLDQIGPITKTVEDSIIGFTAICGPDSKDSTSVQDFKKVDYLEAIKQDIQGMKIAMPEEFFQEGLDPEIRISIDDAIAQLKKLGAEIHVISLPFVDKGLSAYYVISSAEASSNLARYDGIRYGYRTEDYIDLEDMMLKSRSEAFGSEVKRRIMLGSYVLSSGYYDAYYKKAMEYKAKVKDAFSKVFEDYDIIISPTSPVLPFPLGEKCEDPMDMYLADIYTVNVNIAGVPAISLPCGFSQTGLPIGVQFIGDHYCEDKIFRAAYALEQALTLKLEPTLDPLKEV